MIKEADINKENATYRRLILLIRRFEKSVHYLQTEFAKATILNIEDTLEDIKDDYMNRLREIQDLIDKFKEEHDEIVEFNNYYKEKNGIIKNQ
jgi:NAD+--asparagine ADP-ribosyltransferase